MSRKKELISLIMEHKLKKYSGYENNGEEDILIPTLLDEELEYIDTTDTYDEILFLYDISAYLKGNGTPYWLSGYTASSLVLFILGISHTNPLQAHYYYPETGNVEWRNDAKDGYDLPEKEDAFGDGHGIIQSVFVYGDQLYCRGMKDLCVEEGYKTQFIINVPDCCFLHMDDLFINHWYMKEYGFVPEINYTGVPGTENRKKEYAWLKLGNIGVVKDTRKYNNLPEMYGEDNDVRIRDFSEYLAHWSSEGRNIINDTDRFMIKEMGYRLSDLILYEDDIYFYMISHSVSEDDAYIFMRLINERKISWLPITKQMLISNDKWKLNRINRMHIDEPHPVYRLYKSHFVEQLKYVQSLPRKREFIK